MRGEAACGDDDGGGPDDAGEVFVEIPLPGKGARACVTMPLQEWTSGGRTRGQRSCKPDIDGAAKGVNRAKNR